MDFHIYFRLTCPLNQTMQHMAEQEKPEETDGKIKKSMLVGVTWNSRCGKDKAHQKAV